MFRKKQTVNLLDLVPQRVADSVQDEEGIVSLRIPRFKNERLRTILTPSKRKPFVHLKLDRFGTHVWNAIDGRRDVAALAESLLEAFGEEVQPVHERVGGFIRELERNGFIRLLGADGAPFR